ncbi:hypothetical protein [Afifella sp. IM 167]|uniref:hypothetical protein n=1 Tax=Afifella sp. IM 167 TaxID=2033586 RepID=UPI001CCF7EE7|nr:hypothetical protein [Afifella sp. IM 167]
MSQPTDQHVGSLLTGLGAVAVMAASLAFCGSAEAASTRLSVPQCAEHGKMVEILAQEYKELPKALGIVRGERIMQLFVSERGTWTIVVTKTSGSTCIVAAGQDWEEVPVDTSKLEPRA